MWATHIFRKLPVTEPVATDDVLFSFTEYCNEQGIDKIDGNKAARADMKYWQFSVSVSLHCKV